MDIYKFFSDNKVSFSILKQIIHSLKAKLMSSHTKFGPNRFSCFDFYWTITDTRDPDVQAKFMYRFPQQQFPQLQLPQHNILSYNFPNSNFSSHNLPNIISSVSTSSTVISPCSKILNFPHKQLPQQ